MADELEDNAESEIDVERLLTDIRRKLALREGVSEAMYSSECEQGESDISEHPLLDTSRTRSAISSAEAHADVGSQVTPMEQFHGLIRKLASIVGKIVVYVSSFITDKQRSFNRATVRAFSALTEALETFSRDMGVWIRNEMQRSNVQLKGQVESYKSRQEEMINGLRNQQAELKSSLEKTVKDILDNISRSQTELAVRDNLIRDMERTLKDLKSSYVVQERRLITLLEASTKDLTDPLIKRRQDETQAAELRHSLDSLYALFEERFRGSRQEIKKRMEVYLPVIRSSHLGAENMPVLDLGCGRGEWLELLREAGFPAQGVDMNRILVAQCEERGLPVEEGDITSYLRSVPGSSLGAVTGFHVLEHLSFEVMLGLMDEAIRVLKPGGVAIFETPNPQNVLTGSCNFYLDPTHGRPLPSPMMKFVAEARGFSRVEILNLHPYPASFLLSGSELADRFNEYFYGPQDYAVICWKE